MKSIRHTHFWQTVYADRWRREAKGQDGDRINAVLVAAGFSFHLLSRWSAALLRAWISAWLVAGSNAKPA